MICKKCRHYEKPTKDDNRESCQRLVDLLADATGGREATTEGFTVLLNTKYIKVCNFFSERKIGGSK